MGIVEKIDGYLEKEFAQSTTSIFRDLSLNFKKLLEDSTLEPTERWMNLLAIATTLENTEMMSLAKSVLEEMNIPSEQVRECAEVSGIMGMNNIYYKFKSYLPAEVKDNYPRAGLRMQSLMKPQTGKQNFEMMAMAVSIVNGCPQCIVSHEKALTDLGVSADKIHDLARLAAVSKGLSSLKTAIDFLK